MRPRVHFIEILLQEHADAPDSDRETCLNSCLGRINGAS
jgi:hypothetical protein